MKTTDFSGKKVMVTGHTGFKGSWLIHLLKFMGATIKGYALPALTPSLFNISSTRNLCDHFEGDIRRRDLLETEILNFQPDFIFHLAAQPLVLTSYDDPSHTFEVNLMGTVNLLDSLRKHEKPCVAVIVTTDKVYKDQQWHKPYKENDELGGYDPYSASKAACELVVESYRSSFFNPEKYDSHLKSIATARAGNVIGGGDFSENRLVPDILKAISNNEEVIIRNPSAIRPWQHVIEALYSYLVLADHLWKAPANSQLNCAFNFGPEPEDILSVREIVDKTIEIYGGGKCREEISKGSPKETKSLLLDTSKAKALLQRKPKWNIDTALEKTVQWHRCFVEKKFPVKDLMEEQIKSFLSC